MRKRMILLMVVLFMGTLVPGRAQETNPALEVIAGLNAWRISEGLAPLKPNETLRAMAQSQAEYLASLSDLPDDFHRDASGLYPRERALLPPFQWPHYRLPGQVSIGENAAVGTADYALNYWRASDLHRRTALNPDYREVGVGMAPYRSTTIVIVVFGGRPNVLPALVNGEQIYLTSEDFEQAQQYDSIQAVTEIQLFDSEGRPLTDGPVAWSETLDVPQNAGDVLYVLLSDGEHLTLSVVNLSRDQVILPGTYTEAAQPTEAAPQTAVPTTPTTTPVPVIVPTAVPTDIEVQPDLLILYTRDTLDVLNVTAGEADWRLLELDGTVDFAFTQFAQVAQFPLEALPSRHCLQIRSQSVISDVVKPEGCNWVRSLVTVGADRVFWAQGPFEVQYNGVTVATCEPDAVVCAVDLP